MCKLSHIIRAVTIERTHPLLTGGNPQWEGHHQELSLPAAPLTKPGGTLGCVCTVLLWRTHGPLVLAGQSGLHVQLPAWLAVQVEGLFLGSAQHVEAKSVFRGACYTPACRDCGMSWQISIILTTLCRARNKAAYGQRWPVWDLQQPPKAWGFEVLLHTYSPFLSRNLASWEALNYSVAGTKPSSFSFTSWIYAWWILIPIPLSLPGPKIGWKMGLSLLYQEYLAISSRLSFLPDDNLSLSTVLIPQEDAWKTQHPVWDECDLLVVWFAPLSTSSDHCCFTLVFLALLLVTRRIRYSVNKKQGASGLLWILYSLIGALH